MHHARSTVSALTAGSGLSVFWGRCGRPENGDLTKLVRAKGALRAREVMFRKVVGHLKEVWARTAGKQL